MVVYEKLGTMEYLIQNYAKRCMPVTQLKTVDEGILVPHTVTGYDLNADQEDMLSQALVGHSKYDRSKRAQTLESAIKTRAQTSKTTVRSSRQAFTASRSQNAGRFCRKPKERAASEGASPLHALYGGRSGSSSGGGYQNGIPGRAADSTRTCDQPGVGGYCTTFVIPVTDIVPVSSHSYQSLDPHSQVSVTSLNANVHLPMDRLSTKLFNPPERSYTAISSPRRGQGYANGSSCFGVGRGRLTQHYTIHPDWVSESFSCSKAQIKDRGGKDLIDYMKRSQSCPPAQRNVITWEGLKSPLLMNKEPDATSPSNDSP